MRGEFGCQLGCTWTEREKKKEKKSTNQVLGNYMVKGRKYLFTQMGQFGVKPVLVQDHIHRIFKIFIQFLMVIDEQSFKCNLPYTMLPT